MLPLLHFSSLLYAIPSIFEPCELSPNTELHWRNSFRLSATLESWINGKGAKRENTRAIESHLYYTEARYCSFFFVSFFPLSSFVPTSFSICQVVASKLKWIFTKWTFRWISKHLSVYIYAHRYNVFLCLSSLDGFPHLQVTGKGLSLP